MNHFPSLHPLWSSLALERVSGVSLQDQITGFFRAAIVSGRMPRGRRVPSSRQLALEHDISRTTAIEAYETLIAEGYLVARPGAGVFIAEVLPEDMQHPTRATAAPAHMAPENRRIFGPLDVRNFQLPLAPDMPALDQFPWAAWGRLTNQICRERPLNAIAYGDPHGEPVLREAIVEYLAVARGIVCRPHQVIIMSGSEQIWAFAASQVAQPGDTVWAEDPGYPFLQRVLGEVSLQVAPVPVDAEGLDVEAGVRLAPRARLALVCPTHHYPLGITMSLARRKALVAWAQANDAWIFENEIDGDYRYTSQPLTPLYSLAHGKGVIYCGSLSKPLAPGLRINYLVVPEDLIGRLAMRPTLSPMLTQLVLARFSTTGQMAAHMRKMRVLYARRRALLLNALRAEGDDLLNVDSLPDGGLRVMAALRCAVADTQVSARCLESGIKVDPLSRCYANVAPRAGLIMGFASTPDEQIEPAVGVLMSALRSVIAHSRAEA
jgi:GntR family transcriptional regulator/MocR family aminotransferase